MKVSKNAITAPPTKRKNRLSRSSGRKMENSTAATPYTGHSGRLRKPVLTKVFRRTAA